MFRWIRGRRRRPEPHVEVEAPTLREAALAPAPAPAPVPMDSPASTPAPAAAPDPAPLADRLQPRVPPPSPHAPYATYRPGLVAAPETDGAQPGVDVSPDELYLGYLIQYLGKGRLTNVTNGEMTTISIVGRLRDRSIAWVNAQEQWCGHFPASMLHGIVPIEGDTVRARVIAHPWGMTVEAIDTNTHRSQFANRAPSTPVDRSSPPESVLGTWRSTLVAGDLVLADVPYDGFLPIDPQGRRSKQRPAVFIRWEHDYALCRAIYGRSGWVDEQGHGTELTDTPTLDKASVVRNAEFDLQPQRIVRLLGRLGRRDLLRIGLSIDDERQLHVDARLAPSRAHQVPSGTAAEEAFVARHPSLARNVGRAEPADLLQSLLDAIEIDEEFTTQLQDRGVTYAYIGGIFKIVTNAHGISIQKGSFKGLMSEAIEARHRAGRTALSMVHNELDHLVLRTGINQPPAVAATPVDDPPGPEEIEEIDLLDEPAPPPRIQLVLGDDYQMPDLIILDQLATSRMVRGGRLDLEHELERLRDGSDAPGIIVGSNQEGGWAAFQRAARDRGWTIVVADTRTDQLRAAIATVRDHAPELVTVVTTYADIVAEIENCGYDVQEVSSLSVDPD